MKAASGAFALSMAIWVLTPLVVVFCFFGDGPASGADPRDAVFLKFVWFAGFAAIVSVILAAQGWKRQPRLALGSLVMSGALLLLAAYTVGSWAQLD